MLTTIIDRLGHDVKSARETFYENVLGIVHIKCSEIPGWHQEVQLYCQVAHYLEQVFNQAIAQIERLERSKGLKVRPVNTNYDFKAIVSNPKKNTDYVVTLEYGEWTCTCPDHKYHNYYDNSRMLCKHILAAKTVYERSLPAEDRTVANNRKLFEIVNTAIASTSLKISEVNLNDFRIELSQNGEKVAEIWRHGNIGKFALRRPFQPVDYFADIENALKVVLHVHNFQVAKSFHLVQ
ncbi:MAG: SWIM zinc finger family protein [Okeania sp. SIO2F4]|uniref:SWIM zinc finger family protein n=1 Tax=Okeania sp. SIO2F4 TaxID=2607790 RepID=UPI00142A2D77|nr:SWIM zinc finger family protein [Okeania sp. SIO2F4]NES01715.1 SWIM zinc finger family protein [Okeania sp. SIO2F4]